MIRKKDGECHPFFLYMLGTVGIKRIPQSIPHKIDAQHRQQDEGAGEEP